MSTPGWYPDPQDANQLRYYDGQNWTEHSQVMPTQAPEAGQYPPAAGEQAQPGGWAPTQQFEQQAPSGDQGWGGYGTPAADPYAAGAAAHQAPGQPAWGAAAGGAAWQQGPYPPAEPSRRSSKKAPLIITLVVLVVAGLATGGYFLFFNKSESPQYTFAGKEIKEPAAVLSKAEKNLASIVQQRHGVKSKNTRCYYAQPKKPAEDAEASDVAKDLYCGPVLFIDGDPSQPYLQFALSNSEDRDSDMAVLTASSSPVSEEPVSIPNDATLSRPDGATTPKGADGLKAPAPPPADKDVLLATSLTSVTVPAAPESAVIGSWSGGIRLTKLGTIKRFGRGDDARSAPEGQKLIAFQTTGAPSADGDIEDLTSDAEISVDGSSGKPVPELDSGQYVVVAVPEDAQSVDLVLDDEGLTQSISLLDGKPGKDNVVLFTRSNREGETPVSATGVLTFSPKVKFDDGKTGTSESARITVNKVDLFYRTPPGEKDVTASAPNKALMHVSVTYRGAHEHSDYGFPSSMVSFTPTGGSPVKAQNLSLDPEHKIYSTFEVPADVTGGTLTVSGAINQTYSGGTGHYRFGVKSPIKMKISIPMDD